MIPLPDPAVTAIFVDEDGTVQVATNVAPNAKVMVTKSLKEFVLLAEGLPFRPEPA